MLEEHVDDELPSMALDFGDVLTGVAFRAFEIDDYAVIYSPAFPVREREVRGLAGRGKFPRNFLRRICGLLPGNPDYPDAALSLGGCPGRNGVIDAVHDGFRTGSLPHSYGALSAREHAEHWLYLK